MVASASLGSGLTAAFGITATNFTHLPALVLLCALSR
jgi:presenilin-like A22 family membrane protease